MARFFLSLLVAIFIAGNANAQRFNRYDIDYDLNKFRDIKERNRHNDFNVWANDLLRNFPLTVNGAIKFQYVMRADTAYNAEEMRDVIEAWFRTEFGVPPTVGGTGYMLSISDAWANVGKIPGDHYGYSSTINAEVTCKVEIKNDRLRLTVGVPRFRAGVSRVDDMYDKLLRPGDCYPAYANGKEQRQFSVAFINSISTALGKAQSLINMLNARAELNSQKGADDW